MVNVGKYLQIHGKKWYVFPTFTPLKTNKFNDIGTSPFWIYIGNTSWFMVGFPASHVSFPGVGATLDASEIRQTHQLRLINWNPIICHGAFCIQTVVVWDFWTINSTMSSIHGMKRYIYRSMIPISSCWYLWRIPMGLVDLPWSKYLHEWLVFLR